MLSASKIAIPAPGDDILGLFLSKPTGLVSSRAFFFFSRTIFFSGQLGPKETKMSCGGVLNQPRLAGCCLHPKLDVTGLDLLTWLPLTHLRAAPELFSPLSCQKFMTAPFPVAGGQFLPGKFPGSSALQCNSSWAYTIPPFPQEQLNALL